MIYKQPLKQILAATQEHWDRAETRPAVRQNFQKMLSCRTPALGAEVYASEKEEKLVFHTCKARACPSCGHRATLLWQREQWTALPEIAYVGVTLTMPNVLWPIFQRNRNLLHDLPAIGAAAIQQWVRTRYRVRVLVMVVQHTFGGDLKFNPHLHILVSAGGLQESEGRWIAPLRFNKPALMHIWKYAVITYIREMLKANALRWDWGTEAPRRFLKTQYERSWIIHIRHFTSKGHFLRYAGRYARRPPLAQHRFVEITDREVQFLTNDKKKKQVVTTRYSIEEFVARLAEHVPDHYRHAIRHFGLLAPRSKGQTSAALFLLLGQQKRPRPQRLSWRNSLRKHFGIDPLVDSGGQCMWWVGRLNPCVQDDWPPPLGGPPSLA
jgi:hypothetical protein